MRRIFESFQRWNWKMSRLQAATSLILLPSLEQLLTQSSLNRWCVKAQWILKRLLLNDSGELREKCLLTTKVFCVCMGLELEQRPCLRWQQLFIAKTEMELAEQEWHCICNQEHRGGQEWVTGEGGKTLPIGRDRSQEKHTGRKLFFSSAVTSTFDAIRTELKSQRTCHKLVTSDIQHQLKLKLGTGIN